MPRRTKVFIWHFLVLIMLQGISGLIYDFNPYIFPVFLFGAPFVIVISFLVFNRLLALGISRWSLVSYILFLLIISYLFGLAGVYYIDHV